MTISNTNPITAADIDAMIDTQLTAMQADAAQLPLGHHAQCIFRNLVVGTAPSYRQATIIAPFDCFVESVAVMLSGFTAAATFTATLTGNGGIYNFPVTVSGSYGANPTNLTRLLYDGTKGRAAPADIATSQVFRPIPKGTELTLTVSTSSIATPSLALVNILLRSFLARE